MGRTVARKGIHHELSPPRIVLVINIVQSLDKLLKARHEVMAIVGLEERSTESPVEH